MFNHLNMQQHINGCDVLRHLVQQKEEALKKVEMPRYQKYYQREMTEIQELRSALESLSYIIEYPLLKNLVDALEAAKNDISIAGVTVRYPFRPVVKVDDNFSLINLCHYGD